MLNVQQVRLRFIFVRALYPVPLFSKGLRRVIYRRCCTQINPQRIRTDRDVRGSKQKQVCSCKLVAQECTGRTFLGVPAGVFCTLLPSSERTGMSVKLSSSEFAPQTRRWTVYTEVHCSTGYFQKAYGKRLFRTDRDVRGSIQQRVCAANTLVKNVQGCTFFTVPAVNLCSRLVVSERTRMSVVWGSSEFAVQTRRWTVYTEVHCSTGYFKRRWERVFSKSVGVLLLSPPYE